MRGVTALIVLLLVGCASHADLGPEMHVLGTLEEVGGVAVYASGERHPFHELAHAILYEGTEGDFVRLAHDPRPVPRCMGLYLLARSGSPRAEAILERQMSDQASVDVQIGCVGNGMTVGGFARRLLRDRDHLEFELERSPIWPPFEVLADDVRLLAYDGAPLRPEAAAGLLDVHRYDYATEDADLLAPAGEDRVELQPAESIRAGLDKGAVALDAVTFARLCRGLPRWRVVKALGRAGPHPAVRRFLLARLGDAREDARTRLVAASALTRDSAPDALAALQSYADSVNQWSGDPAAGAELIRQAELRTSTAAVLRENAAHQAWEAATSGELSPAERRSASVPERVFAALEAAGDPVLLDWRDRVAHAFDDGCNDGYDDRDFNWLLAASAKLREHRAPWDTYSDAVHPLATSEFFDAARQGSLFGDGEAEDDPNRIRFNDNVREALRALDREPR